MSQPSAKTVSAVIPVWNEEYWLPRILSPLAKSKCISQIILSDNSSRDRSAEIGVSFGCEIVKGGSPARGRNSALSRAFGEIILFLDADVVIDDKIIASILAHFENPKVIAASPRLKPITDDIFVRLCYGMMDMYFRVARALGVAQGVGGVIAVRRSAVCQVGGFSEILSVGEDIDFVRRLSYLGEVRYDERIVSFISARRFLVENKFVFAFKCVVWAIVRVFGLRLSPWGYRWVQYPREIAEHESAIFSKMSL
jgi:glycosyltransferase involved in cell wall biosynthesis